MKVRNDLQTVTIAARDGWTVEGVTRARTFDARVAGRGWVFAQREPVAVIVRDGGGVRRATLRERDEAPWVAAFVAAPLVYLAIRRSMRKRGKR